jgi:hypothetical protein
MDIAAWIALLVFCCCAGIAAAAPAIIAQQRENELQRLDGQLKRVAKRLAELGE